MVYKVLFLDYNSRCWKIHGCFDNLTLDSHMNLFDFLYYVMILI